MTTPSHTLPANPDLRLLGAPGPTYRGESLARLGQKTLILLARLVVDPRPIAREAVMALLWPESDEDHARGSLRQGLYVLRATFGADLLTGDRQRITVRHPPSTDVLDFLNASREGHHRMAVLAYSGTLLDGIELANATEAELWLALERRRLAHLFEEAAISALTCTQSATPSHGLRNGDGASITNGARAPNLHVVLNPHERLQVAQRLRDHAPKSVRAWQLLLAELSRSANLDTLRFERAELAARVETGQIDNRPLGLQLLNDTGLQSHRPPFLDDSRTSFAERQR